ncbi:MAG: CbiX/SirB N-terminal domain-containing protein [Verrucomicrobiae bacterium]|nr:CbiX/SirB N-terminal domain-containing protein [Verrucomicrobiae bacterium]
MHPSRPSPLHDPSATPASQRNRLPPPPPAQTALFIVGHGTSLNENSTQIIYRQAHIIRQKHIYAEVHAAFMEEAPYIKDWPSITSQPNVIVVPFFIADGLHSYEDIPVLLGMTDNVRTNPFRNPHTVGHRRLWYARAIGTHPFIADVILASVQSFIDDHPEIFQNIPTPKPDALSSWIASLHFPHRIGQLTIHKQHSHYLLTHHHPTPPLKTLQAATTEDLLLALLRLSKKSPSGEYRYLTTSPDLPTDWQTPPLTLEQLISALQILHPNALIDRYLYEHNLLPITPIHHTTSRQTGMYRRTSTATPHHITQAQKKICHKHCSKIPLWHPDPPSPSPPPLAPHHIPCPEACNAYISTLRETLLNETPTPQPSHT